MISNIFNQYFLLFRPEASSAIRFIVDNLLEGTTMASVAAATESLKSDFPSAYAYMAKEWLPQQHRLFRPYIRRYLTLGKSTSSLAESAAGRVKNMFLTGGRTLTLETLISELLQLDAKDFEAESLAYARLTLFQKNELSDAAMQKVEAAKREARQYRVVPIAPSDLVAGEDEAFEVSRSSKVHRVSFCNQTYRCSCLEDATTGLAHRHIEAVFLLKSICVKFDDERYYRSLEKSQS